MRNVLTMILAGGAGERLYPLTRNRAKPAVPFGGQYRIIDFTLSNCINSDLRRINVIPQYKYNSLMRHIRTAWNVVSRPLGEFIDIIPPQMRVNQSWYLGTADAIYQNLYSVDQAAPEDIIILSADHIYKMDYRKMMYFHRAHGADLTVAAIEVPLAEASRFGILRVDDQSRITGFQEKPIAPAPSPGHGHKALASMGIYIFRADLLREVCIADAENRNSSHDFGKDIIPALVGKSRVCAYTFEDENRKEALYWRDVGTIASYFDANMDLVEVDPLFNLYDKNWPLRGCAVSAPPAKFVFGDHGHRFGAAIDSIVGPGCILSGGVARRCVISPDVRINSYALVENSILFEGACVGRHSRIRNTIVEKHIHLPEGTTIGYDLDEDQRRFHVTPEGIVVVAGPLQEAPALAAASG